MVYTMTRRHSSPTDPVKVRAKVFSNGRSQAIRLPKEFRFAGTEVLVHRDGDAVILEPVPVLQFLRDGQEELTQQEGAERTERHRDDQALVSVDPIERAHHQEKRNNDHRLRHHQRCEVDDEQAAATGKFEPRKRVAG